MISFDADGFLLIDNSKVQINTCIDGYSYLGAFIPSAIIRECLMKSPLQFKQANGVALKLDKFLQNTTAGYHVAELLDIELSQIKESISAVGSSQAVYLPLDAFFENLEKMKQVLVKSKFALKDFCLVTDSDLMQENWLNISSNGIPILMSLSVRTPVLTALVIKSFLLEKDPEIKKKITATKKQLATKKSESKDLADTLKTCKDKEFVKNQLAKAKKSVSDLESTLDELSKTRCNAVLDPEVLRILEKLKELD